MGSMPNNYLIGEEQFDPVLGIYYNRVSLGPETGQILDSRFVRGNDL